MSRSYRLHAFALAAAAAMATLTACSDSGGDGSSSAPETASTSAAASSSAASSGSPASSALTSTVPTSSAGGLEAALLTVADVGTGYSPTSTGTTDSPLPCTPDKQPLFMQAPPAQKAQMSFVNGPTTVQVGETVAEYADASGAGKAFTIGSAGFSCAQGTIGGQKVRIVKRASGAPASTPGVDDLVAYDFAAGTLKGTAVLVQLEDRLAALTFSSVGTAGNGVPVGAIVTKAIARVLAHA